MIVLKFFGAMLIAQMVVCRAMELCSSSLLLFDDEEDEKDENQKDA